MLDAYPDRLAHDHGPRGLFRIPHVAEQLAEGEQPHQHGEKIEALLHGVDAEGEPGQTADLVLAHRRNQQAGDAGDDPLDQVVTGKAGNDGEGEQHQREVVPRSELEADSRKLGRKHHEKNRADHAAEKRRPHADAKSQAGLSFPRHGKSVESRGHRGRRARNAGEHAGHQASREPAHEYPDHHRQTSHRIHAEGERQGKDHRHGYGEAGDRAGNKPGSDTDRHQQQGVRLPDSGKCGESVTKNFHARPPTAPSALSAAAALLPGGSRRGRTGRPPTFRQW